MRRMLDSDVVAVVLVGVEPEAEATWQRARAHMLFGRRGARTAVARAFVGCAGGWNNGSTGWMGRGDAKKDKDRQGKGC